MHNTRPYLLPTLLLLLFLCGQPSAVRAAPSQMVGKVIHVDDGDTVIVLTPSREQVRIRLASIDAPETSHGDCRPGQPWSDQSRQRLRQLVLGKEMVLHCYELDRYERPVCDLPVAGGTANLTLVSEGLAWANRGGRGYIRDQVVVRAETQARAARLGLWQDAYASPPWEWRKTEWKAPQPGCVRRGDRR
jgi:micrococcal nuclease